ncbi:hypothetical protein PsorP6_007322 [Peronosclerospora sorghi]|uniref:Uncharacterized protein n=1 Tax=Peronosclerospora sorghi TaxID=230839 RepID=A0ACC0W8U8_9STRA|nr:hypothetical protein PsorP6_007322 [Peronosclerospora sorghi]
MQPLCLVLVLVLHVSTAPSSQGAVDDSIVDAGVPKDAATVVHTRRNIADDHVRVLYCTACGYQQNFHQLKAYVEETFPHLIDRVDGSNYDVEPYKMMLAQFLGYAQLTTILLTVFGEYILPALGIDMTLLRWMQTNRIATIFVVLLMGAAASKLTASGAFEIYFNGT